MELAADLSEEALAEAMPGRPLRRYVALLSTESDALAWARSGAPEGAVVVADQQSAPRGRAGWPWKAPPGRNLGFSLVLRPQLPLEREGWLYTVAASALADAIGEEAKIEWPDEVQVAGARAGFVAVRSMQGFESFEWAIVSVLVLEAPGPRAEMLARIVEAIEERCRTEPEAVLADYRRRCATLGRRVRLRLVPMGTGRPRLAGEAVAAREDGALGLETGEGKRVGVRPQDLDVIEDEPAAAEGGGASAG